MKFTDLQAEYAYYEYSIEERWDRIKRSNRYLFGSELEELEDRFSKVIRVQNSVGVGGGTDALSLVVDYVYDRIQKEYEEDPPIILPNFGATPTAFCCRLVTDNLYYIDVDDSLTMNPEELYTLPSDLRNGIIVAVNLFGNNCNMEEIMNYAELRGHTVIEDCAQSTGSGSGTKGDYSIFSFYPTKPLASMGDGGMICSNNDLTYFKKARHYGVEYGYLGDNSRMDEWQAAVVNAKLSDFEGLNEKRIGIAERYSQVIQGMKINGKCVYHQFPVCFKNRDEIIKDLLIEKIPYMIHYPNHLNDIPVLQGRQRSEVNYRVNDKIVSLPIHPFLAEEEIEKIENFLSNNRYFESS